MAQESIKPLIGRVCFIFTPPFRSPKYTHIQKEASESRWAHNI